MKLRAVAPVGPCGFLVAVLILGSTAPVAIAASIPLGSLTVRSQPEVEILWDDVAVGTTDRQGVLEIGDIPPGSYLLLLSKQGFQSRSRPLEIGPGAQVLNLPLITVVEVPPFPPASPVWPTALAAIVILIAGATIYRMATQRPRSGRSKPEMAGPKVILGRPQPRSNQDSMLLRDLKRYEDRLDNFVEAGAGGLKRKVINVEVVDHRSVESPGIDDAGGEDR